MSGRLCMFCILVACGMRAVPASSKDAARGDALGSHLPTHDPAGVVRESEPSVMVQKEGDLEGRERPVGKPPRGEEHLRISEAGASSSDGYMDLTRTRDGRGLWVVRRWDDGATVTTAHFAVKGNGPVGGVLQFVDGIAEERTGPSECTSGRYFKTSGHHFELLDEAWIVDAAKRHAIRPKTGDSFPLVALNRAYDAKRASKLQWMVFSKGCPETGSACVYFGPPDKVCRRYVELQKRENASSLWISPSGC